MIGIGVAGLGRIGRLHAEVLRTRVEGARLVAVMDVVDELAREVGERLRSRWYVDYESFLRDEELDAVVICTPTFTHLELVSLAAREGKHVLCEGPLAPDSRSAERLLEEVEEAGIVLQVGYARVFDKACTEAKKRIERGEVERPLLISCRRVESAVALGWRCDIELSGGIFLDLLSEDIYTAMWLADSEPSAVFAAGGAFAYEEVRERGDLDTALLTMWFEDGSLATLVGARRPLPWSTAEVEVLGRGGSAIVRFEPEIGVEIFTRQGTLSRRFGGRERILEAYAAQDSQFAYCISKRRVPLVTGGDGKKVIEVAEAAWRALRSGGRVDLRP